MWELKTIALIYCYFTIIAVYGDKPLSPTAAKSYCEITNNDFHVAYNFTKLTKPDEDIIITNEYPSESLRIQLCSPLKKPCNGKEGYGICLINNKGEKGIGKIPPKVVNEPGKMLFSFTGDMCNAVTNYTVTVIMKCDYSAIGFTHPDIFPHTEEQCNLHLIWRTSLACREAKKTNCTVTNNGLHYDLSPLTRYTENYVIPTGDTSAPKIILNVCHSVIFEHSALCLKYSGACLHSINQNSKEEFVNLGDVENPPVIENDQLKIVYDTGAICKRKEASEGDIKTTISFICDFDAVDTFPEYVKGSEECHYQLIWKTPAACSVESLMNHSISTSGSCSVTNPIRNVTYNLQSLMNKDFNIVAQSGNKYVFRICSSLNNSPCKDSGICFEKNKISMGKVNANLLWQEGGPYLNYTDGDICENGQHRNTIIAFVCGPEGSANIPVVMEEYPCQLIINWNTDLVCDKRIKCATDNGEINLSPLIKSNENYVLEGGSLEIQINICRPLVPVPGLTCAHGSAVCKAAIASKHEYVNETTLGFPLENPMFNEDNEVVLRYLGGSKCSENPSKLVSTNITFPCHFNSNKGSPSYKDYKDCTFIFEWKTSLTCASQTGEWDPPCIIRDQDSHEYDLSLLHKEDQTHHIEGKDGKKYSLNLCGGEKFCYGSAVCLGANGFGSLTSVIFYYNMIKLVYVNGSKCLTGSYTSEVQLICDLYAGIGTPKMLWESNCSVAIEWRTNITCMHESKAQKPAEPEIVQGLSPSHAGVIASIILTIAALLGALFYFRDPTKRASFRSCLSSCNSKRNTGRVQYHRVAEEAWLLLDADPTQCQTDSDDDLLNA